MNALAWLPRPASWASAVLLFAFSFAVNLGMAVVIPLLFELMPRAPRLAWLGLLLVWLAPIGLAGAGHRAMHAALDIADIRKVTDRAASPASSLWAGFVAWANILVVTTATALVLLVLDPPPVDPDAAANVPGAAWTLLGQVTSSGLGGGALRALVWIALAAYVYELERAARPSAGRA